MNLPTSSTLALCLSSLLVTTTAFTTIAASTRQNQKPPAFALHANRKSSFVEEEAQRLDEEEQGAEVVGANFFGGNKQKDELFDPVAEANANLVVPASSQCYNRFDDRNAFDDLGKVVGGSLQQQLNGILYVEDAMPNNPEFTYAPNVVWESPWEVSKDSKTPWDEVKKCLAWYNRMDVAIISAKSTTGGSAVQLRWEISLVWPIFWEPRVILTGTSHLSLQGKTIVKQIDTLDQKDILSAIAPQLKPRFWDVYHIGMTPSAELSPVVDETPFLKTYKVYQLPPRLIYQPSVLDDGNREDANAATIPNHCFCDAIKTMGPSRQRYVPTSPVEVQIMKTSNSEFNNRIVWTIPMSIELQTNPRLPLPGVDEETLPEMMPETIYKFQERRKVAVVSYGGFPQDPEVSGLRKKLYDQVIKDGLKPKLDENERPQFFFRQHNVKACCTEGGLGMVVYEWRPKFVALNEIGIELEL